MLIEDLVLWTIVNVSVVTVLAFMGLMMSWGFTSMADCFEVNFDPVCYSVSKNKQVDVDEPMWFPTHKESER